MHINNIIHRDNFFREEIMKKSILPIIICCVSLMVIHCFDKEEKVEEKSKTKQSRVTGTLHSAHNYDSLLTAILALQDSLVLSPQSDTLIDAFLSLSFDSASGSYFIAGKGVANETQPEAMQQSGKVRAAESTAKRWALYLRAWHLDKEVPFGKEISGTVAYSKTVFERQTPDTLFRLLQVPIGSVSVN
jgi:hypothetical protein